jgi:hypothetical protein
MRTIIAGSAVVLFLAARGFAGEVFGSITEGGKPLPAGVKVEIASAAKTYAGETDKFGAYRIFVKEKGKASITVYAKDSLGVKAELFSYDKSTRYDWILEMKEGKPTLRRK